ncbi:MAG: hypothetical protein ACOZF0_17400 [Thermodesulfobacteriota bacterium]
MTRKRKERLVGLHSEREKGVNKFLYIDNTGNFNIVSRKDEKLKTKSLSQNETVSPSGTKIKMASNFSLKNAKTIRLN